jgi:NADH:ubiquinone oxidoreductase subunit 6 (subunit J)
MQTWPIIVSCALGFLGVYLLLPRPRPYPVWWGACLCGAAVVVAGWLVVNARAFQDWVETLMFYVFAAIAVLGAGMLISQRNPVHAALSFALVVLSTCGLFLLQAAPFLMAATIIVYAGAIIVTFLFVIMLAQQEGRSDADLRSREPLLSTVASFVLLAALLYVLRQSYDTSRLDRLIAEASEAAAQPSATEMAAALGDDSQFFKSFEAAVRGVRTSPDVVSLAARVTDAQEIWNTAANARDATAMKRILEDLVTVGEQVRGQQGKLSPSGNVLAASSEFSKPPLDKLAPQETVAPLGRSLFTDYLIGIELAGTLLLVATIGAIAIAGRRTEGLR